MKYIVIKVEDAEKYLMPDDEYYLTRCLNKIEEGRRLDGKKPRNTYLVINTDEPYVAEVAEIMRKHGHEVKI